jgi:RNA polymerase sigma factor (sigma-70 family)
MQRLVYLNDLPAVESDIFDPPLAEVYEEEAADRGDLSAYVVDENEPDPMILAAAAEDVNWLRDCMATLPDEQRRALELLYVQGFTYPEAAAEMELSEAAVRRRMSAGIRSLQLAADGR